MNARIRLARITDINGMLALEQLFPSDRLSRAALRRFFRVASAQLWVAIQNGSVVGDLVLLQRANSLSSRIYSVVVAPSARGQGLGNRLIARAERAARAEGRERVRLEVRADNSTARSLYARRGYRQVAALSHYYEDGADGLRLEKSLR